MTEQYAEDLYGPAPVGDEDPHTSQAVPDPGETSGPYYCPEQTYPQTRDDPAEYCEAEVPADGDFCPRHDPDDEEPEREDR